MKHHPDFSWVARIPGEFTSLFKNEINTPKYQDTHGAKQTPLGAAIVGSVPDLPKYQRWKSSYFKIIGYFPKVLYVRGKKQTEKNTLSTKSALYMLL